MRKPWLGKMSQNTLTFTEHRQPKRSGMKTKKAHNFSENKKREQGKQKLSSE
jgi:hypothetical protein